MQRPRGSQGLADGVRRPGLTEPQLITKADIAARTKRRLKSVERCLGKMNQRGAVTAKNERLDLLTAIKAGGHLTALKDDIGHGNWMDWSTRNLPAGISHRTANVWMQVSAAANHPDIRSAANLRQALSILNRIKESERRRGLAETPPNPDGKFGLIMSDPPWPLEGVPYATMSIDAIMALPVAEVAADDCALFLWRIHKLDEEAHQVMRAWGFEFSGRILTWVKNQPGQHPWLGSRVETCLIGLRGKPVRLSGHTDVIECPRERHSAKPDEAFQLAEAVFPMAPGHKLELFARFGRDGHYPRAERGWVGWGDEIAKRDKWNQMAKAHWGKHQAAE